MKKKLLLIAPAAVLLSATAWIVLLIQHSDANTVMSQSAMEIKINIPSEMEQPIVDTLPDGSALAMGQIVTYKGDSEIKATETSEISAARYDLKGKLLWSRVYAELDDGYVTHARLLPGGGFVFSYGALQQYENGKHTPPIQYLVFCNPGGDILKIHEYNQQFLYQYLLVADNGDVITVGEAYFKDGVFIEGPEQTNSSTDIAIMRLSSDGTLKYCRKFGGSDFDSPTGASWSPATGLVLAIRAQSKDGDIKNANTDALKAETSVFLLAAFNEDGSVKWQYLYNGLNSYLPGQIVLADGYITACGFKDNMLYVFKLDENGKALWESDVAKRESVMLDFMAQLRGQTIAVGVHTISDNRSVGNGQIVLLGPDGTVLSKTEQEYFQILNMLPTDDGGLFIISNQIVKALPTPLYLSSIWYDTETIVTKLDKNLKTQWRKIYDKYRDSRRQDVAVPLESGWVVVEK